MTNQIFLDTSGLLCLFDTADARHDSANKHFCSAARLVTTNYVLAEFIPLAHVRGLKRENSIHFVLTLIELPRLELIWIDRHLHDEGMDLLKKRVDKTYSLCDAVSFIVMREHGLTDALTTDKHFAQEKFIKIP